VFAPVFFCISLIMSQFLVVVHHVGLFSLFRRLDMGEGARRRLQQLALNFEQKVNNIGGGQNAGRGGGIAGPQRGALHEASGAAAERRGLLDDDEGEDMIEFETRKKSD
jgi:hypothetical protein